MDRKAAYHTCFACDDLAAGESVFQSSLRCEKHRDRCYLRLDPRYKGSVRMVQFQANTNAWHYVPADTVVTLDRLYFTQHRPIVPVVDDGPAVPLDDALSATDLVRAMKVGWNLRGSPGGLAPPAPPRSGWGEASSPSRSAPYRRIRIEVLSVSSVQTRTRPVPAKWLSSTMSAPDSDEP